MNEAISLLGDVIRREMDDAIGHAELSRFSSLHSLQLDVEMISAAAGAGVDVTDDIGEVANSLYQIMCPHTRTITSRVGRMFMAPDGADDNLEEITQCLDCGALVTPASIITADVDVLP